MWVQNGVILTSEFHKQGVHDPYRTWLAIIILTLNCCDVNQSYKIQDCFALTLMLIAFFLFVLSQ